MASMGDPVVLIYDEQCAAYAASGHPERPQRVLSSAARLREQTKISFEWHAPRLAPRKPFFGPIGLLTTMRLRLKNTLLMRIPQATRVSIIMLFERLGVPWMP